MRKKAKSMNRRVVPEDNPEYKALWEDYMQNWVISEDKKDVCIIFQNHHCTLVSFKESLSDNIKRNPALYNHKFFLITTMRDITGKLEISLEKFYDSETYKADIRFANIKYFC